MNAIRRLIPALAVALLAMSAKAQAASTYAATRVLDRGSGGQVGHHASQAIVNGNPAVSYLNFSDLNLMYARNSAADGSGIWSIATVDAPGFVGMFSSLAVVNGRPAISYQDSTTGNLKYVRALDVNGTSWGAPVVVDIAGSNGIYTSLVVINGRPAISYYDQTGGDLKYVRALDADGAAWGAAVRAHQTGNVGQFTSMAVVDGNPAISYFDVGNEDLMFVRADDIDGASWGTPVRIDSSGAVGSYTSLAVVDGNPAISYYDLSARDLKYVRASDAGGASWAAPARIDSGGFVGQYTSLEVVNGRPAISYYDQSSAVLKYARASDAGGANWGSPLTVDASFRVGQHTSLLVVDGRPAIIHVDFNNWDLKYVRASDADGSAWPAGTIADSGFESGNVGEFTSIAIVDGNPAVAYYDGSNTDLKYVRALDAGGTSWGSPVTVASANNVGQYTSLAVVNGNPAISYYEQSSRTLKYVRALDAAGTSWGSPVSATTGQYSSLVVVDDRPAIAYYDDTNRVLRYVRANDANGTSWGTPVTVDTDGGFYISMTLVNGRPAISYTNSTGLKYVQSSNGDGASWGSPVSISIGGSGGTYTSLAVVNGCPAISYQKNNLSLGYVRATDADGTTWSAAIDVDTAGTVGQYTSLAVISGNPAISYYSVTNGDLKYVRANDADGTTWAAPFIADSVDDVGQYSFLREVDGNASISYYDTTSDDLKWATLVSVYPPTVTAPTSASVTASTAVLGGSITADGGAPVTERGVVYARTSLNSDPVIGGANVTQVPASMMSDVFTVDVTGLAGHLGYTFKAYATTSADTGYSSPASFSTANTAPSAPDGAATGSTGDQKTVTVSFPATDADADAVTITAAAAVAGLTVDGFTETSVTFTPDSSFTGSGSFTYTVGDGHGGSATGTITVTISDNDAPTVAAHAHVTAEATGASGTLVTFAAGSANDNVTASPALTYSQNSGTLFPLGVTEVTIFAMDDASNTGTGTFTVTVQDTTAPVVAPHANVTVNATSLSGAVVTYLAASAFDAVTSSPAITYSQNSGTTFPIGTTTVTISARDAADNTGTGTFTVTVATPEIAIAQPSSMDLESGTSNVAFGNVVVGASSAAKTFTVANSGTANLVISAVAVSGGHAGDFAVTAGSLPLTVPPASNASLSVVFTPGETTARSTTLQVSSNDLNEGSFQITLSGAGVPNTPPVVTLTGASPLTFEAAATYADPGASASDVDDGALTPTISSNNVAPHVPGTYSVTWTATDTLGLTGSRIRTVNVVDTTAPVITPPANISVNPAVTTPPSAAGTNVTFAATATDAVGVTSLTYSPASGSLFALNTTTTVTVTAKDAANNTSTATFTVRVRPKDNTPPVLTVTSPAPGVSLITSSPMVISGTVKDDVEIASVVVKLNDVELTLDSPVVSVPNTNIPFQISGVQPRNGSNKLDFKVTDASGKTATVTRNFTFQNSRPELAGTFDALLATADVRHLGNIGLVTATLNNLGAVSGKIILGGTTVIFPAGGLLTNEGEARFSATQTEALELKNASNMVLGYLRFSIDENSGMTGEVSTDAAGNTVIASFSGLKAPYSASNKVPDSYLTHPAGGPYTQGSYTVVFGSREQTPVMGHALYPQGDGIGQMTLNATGGFSMSVRLPDGTIIGASGKLREDGTAVCYNPLYSNQGGVGMQFSFEDLTDSDVTTTECLWIRPEQPAASQYGAGWPNGIRMDGVGTKLSQVSNPNFGQGAEDLVSGNTSLVFTDGLLAAPLSYAVSINPTTGAIAETPVSDDYLLNYTANNGMIAGSFLHTDGTTVNYVGIMLNKGGNRGGFGFFLSSGAGGESGGMSLDPDGL